MATFTTLLPTPRAREGNSGTQDAGLKHGLKKGYLDAVIATSSLEDFPANLSPKPDEEKERQMTATSGHQCLSASLFSDQNGSSLKMLRDSLLGTTAWFSRQCALIWKRKVTKYSRLLYQLAPSARRIDAIEFGLLATPNTMDLMAPKTERAVLKEATVTRRGRTKMANLRDQLFHGMLLKTPSASEHEGGWKVTDKYWDAKAPKLKMRDQIGRATGLKLQPRFVEWMMGFPDDWTEIPDSKLLEMRLSRRSQKKS